MILETRHLNSGQLLRTEVCIVGGGPAAISLALALAGSNRTVMIIAGGGWSETEFNHDLNRGATRTDRGHEPLEENRRRQFGGGSAVWGGRCLPFDSLDFEQRGWVPNSGWPFPAASLLPYYRRAGALCQVGNYEFNGNAAFPLKAGGIIPGFDSPEIVSYPLERWSPPINFARAYRKELESNCHIRVLLDAHALRLETAAGGHIRSVRASMGGKPLVIQAERFVLAAGGLENPRLLLASANADYPAGLGNQHDNVGRYYMSHLSGNYAELIPREPERLSNQFERDDEGVYCRRRWWITEKAQRDRALFNTVFFLSHSNSPEGHDVAYSSRHVAKSLQAIARQPSWSEAWKKGRELSPVLGEHSFNLVWNGLPHVPTLLGLGLKRLSHRRLPCILPLKGTRRWGLWFQAEQAPNRASRITLSPSETDAFGVPRAEAQIVFSAADLDSVVRAHNLFVDNFRSRNLGIAIYTEEGLRGYLAERIGAFNSAAHHLGTTRMSRDPRLGVVDENAQVHGWDNLYIAGSSVFPTGGHANPTLTVVAQSLKLADYLRRQAELAA